MAVAAGRHRRSLMTLPLIAASATGLEVSLAAARQKLKAMDQFAARHQVAHLGMPGSLPVVGRSSGAGCGP